MAVVVTCRGSKRPVFDRSRTSHTCRYCKQEIPVTDGFVETHKAIVRPKPVAVKIN